MDLEFTERFQQTRFYFRACGTFSTFGRPVGCSSLFSTAHRITDNTKQSSNSRNHKQPAAHGRSITGRKWAPADHGQVNMSCYYDSSPYFVWTVQSGHLYCGKPALKRVACLCQRNRASCQEELLYYCKYCLSLTPGISDVTQTAGHVQVSGPQTISGRGPLQIKQKPSSQSKNNKWKVK